MLLIQRLLPRFAVLTVVLLYLVVIAGAVVRATGSGMGCPDWPKCFGRLIPPTSVSQIPEEFMEKFLTEGHGNLAHTWVEYINRLLGALSGISTMITLVLAAIAAKARRLSWRAPLVLLAGLVIFLFVAWLGKVVVDTSLAPRKVTVHFLGGLALVSAAVMALVMIRPGRPVPVSPSLRWHLVTAFALLVLQIVLGTQVREAVDQLAAGECCDGRLEQRLGIPMVWHRVGAVSVLTLIAIAFFRMKFLAGADAAAPLLITTLGLMVCAEYGVGVALVIAGLPRFLQPAHLFMATALHGMLLALLLRSRLQMPPAATNLALA
jgi:heme a synthase